MVSEQINNILKGQSILTNDEGRVLNELLDYMDNVLIGSSKDLHTAETIAVRIKDRILNSIQSSEKNNLKLLY